MQRVLRAVLLVLAAVTVIVTAVVFSMPKIEKKAPEPTPEPIAIRLISSGAVGNDGITAIAAHLTADGGTVIDENAESRFVFYCQAIRENRTYIVAGMADQAPELYVVEDGRVSGRTSGARAGKLHLTRDSAYTILFGTSFAFDKANPAAVVKTTRAMATFLSGSMAQCAMYRFTVEDVAYPGGYLLIVPEAAQPASVTLLDGDRPVAPLSETKQFLPSGLPWEGTDRALWAQLQFVPLTAAADAASVGEQLALAVESPDGAAVMETLLCYRNGNGFLLSDVWRNSNAFGDVMTVRAGDTLTLSHIPEATGLMHLVLIEQDDGTDSGAAAAMRPCVWDEETGRVTLPEMELATPQYAMLVIQADRLVYATLLRLV